MAEMTEMELYENMWLAYCAKSGVSEVAPTKGMFIMGCRAMAEQISDGDYMNADGAAISDELQIPAGMGSLHGQMATTIFHTYIGVSSSRIKAAKCAEKLLAQLMEYYEKVVEATQPKD